MFKFFCKVFFLITGFGVLSVSISVVLLSLASRADVSAVNASDIGGLAHFIASEVIRPFVESRIDRYLENYGMSSLFTRVRAESRQALVVKVIDMFEGKGTQAVCGDEVLVSVARLSFGEIEDANAIWHEFFSERHSVRDILGYSSERFINWAIHGMRVGGERIVRIDENYPMFVDHKLAQSSDVDAPRLVYYYVKLEEVFRKVARRSQTLQIFDNFGDSDGRYVRCGDAISLNYVVRDVRGSVISDVKGIKFKVGAREVSAALEIGVIGLKVGSDRTVIAPASMMNTIHDKSEVSILDLKVDKVNDPY